MDGPSSDLDDQAMEAETDALVQHAMPDAFATMLRARAAQAAIPAPTATNVAVEKREPQPTVTVALITPEAMKQPEARLTAMASLAALAFAAAINGYQRALAGNGASADAHLTQAARQSLTAASLIEALNGAPNRSNRTVPVRSSRETWNAYQRDLMRRRRALKRESRLDA